MADQTPRAGRLIAVDASRGVDVLAETERLGARLRERGIEATVSRWDASGLFGDLLLADPDPPALSGRMLTLLYAADLVFRLRWELQPALAEGRVVIAAPYVHTAIAVAVGAGLPDTWVRDVLRFAPPADAVRFARERKPRRGWKPAPTRGYGEFAAFVMGDGLKRRARRAAATWLHEQAAALGAGRRKELVARLAALPSHR
jgi:hypothetical protein